MVVRNNRTAKLKEDTSKVNGLPNGTPKKTAETPSEKVNGNTSSPHPGGKKAPSLGELRKVQPPQTPQSIDNGLGGEKVLNRPTASGESLAVLLTQGLMSHDDEKLDSVLRNTDIIVIQATLAEMQVTHIVPLLRTIERRLRNSKALDIRPWIRWAQCIFTIHLSYLSSLKTLEKDVGGLMDWMRARTSHSARLLALHGKMSVLAEHIEKRSNTELEPLPQPLIVFNTDALDTSDEEEMDSMDDDSGGSSEEEWWDDGGIAKADEDDLDDEESEDEEEEEKELLSKRKRRHRTDEDNEDGDDDGEDDVDDGGDEDDMDES